MIVDRIEGAIAVIEIDGQTIDIPTQLLPEGTLEGDRLRLVIQSNDKKTTEAEDRLKRLQSTDQEPDHIDL